MQFVDMFFYLHTRVSHARSSAEQRHKGSAGYETLLYSFVPHLTNIQIKLQISEFI
jgi:hypothetical protein